MIAFVKGNLEEILSDSIIVDKDGIGIQIFTTNVVLEKMPPIHSEVKLHTHFHVKEDLLQLYGFLSMTDLKLFKLLISVSGVGPKGAISILSSMDTDTLVFAILAEDSKTLSKAQGVGKKVAQKIILEIKDKVGNLNEDIILSSCEEEDEENSTFSSVKNEAIEVLKALGYSATEALQAVKSVEITSGSSSDEIVKQALKFIN